MTERGELADLLVAWRRRLPPAAVGLPAVSTRVSGLRREEVAMLANLSVDYVVRLEQGRAEHPSAQVAGALARVLQLTTGERDQLFLAARLPVPLPTHATTLIPASVQRLLARLPDVAIGVYTVHWTLLTANAAWTALLGTAPAGFNLIVAQFTGTAPPVRMSGAYIERFERALVSDLRGALLRYPRDPSVREVYDRLTPLPRFAELWAEGSVVEQESRPKTFAHPLVGSLTLDCDVFTAVGSDLRVITYTAAPGTDDASKFDLIRTVNGSMPTGRRRV